MKLLIWKLSILNYHSLPLKKYAAAFALGALMTLSTPPIGAFFILLLCVPGLI